MIVFAPEVHSFFLKPFVDYIREKKGDEQLNQILREFDVTQKELADSTAWVSLEFYESFFARVVQIFGDFQIFDHCARLSVSPEYMGFIRPLFRTLGNPIVAYTQVAKVTKRFNRVGSFEFEQLGPSHVRLIYKSIPGAPKENTNLACIGRIAQVAALTTMFDLPPAQMEHPKCMQRGDEACVYEAKWKAPRRSKAPWVGLGFGGIGGAALSVGAGVSLGIGSVLTLLSGTGAWSFTKISSLKREISERADDLLQQQEALTAATKRHDERYEELLQAKQATEQIVEERTKELEVANIQLKSLDELKSQFIANVSHELRTPLTLTLGPIEHLLNTEADAQRHQELETIYRNQQRLYKLIDDLLDFTRLEAGKTDLRFSKEDIVEHVRYMASTLEAATKSRNIRFTVDVPRIPIWIYADRDKLEKIVMNLLSNAFKFTPDGGSIGIRLREQGEHVKVEIQDSGPGIPNDKLMSIFDRFSQLDSSQTRRFGGTGIGLAMVREYTEMHGGSVDVKSMVGQGSTFSVQFRKGKKHLDEALIAEDFSAKSEIRGHHLVEFTAEEIPSVPSIQENAISRTNQPLNASELESLTQHNIDTLLASLQRETSILIVDDHVDMRNYLYSILRTEYPTIYVAKDGLEALEIARNFHPDLIVSDVMMPRMSGEELCKAIKNESGRLSRTPVILLTARAGMSSKLEGLETGANDYLIKPFHAEELKLRVRNMLYDRLKEQALFLIHRELAERKRELDEDLAMAGDFQRSLLAQPQLSEPFEFHAIYRPLEKVGGDIYDVTVLSPNKVRVFLVDVNGHGVDASLRTTIILDEYRLLTHEIDDPGKLLTELNRRLMEKHKARNVAFSACCFDAQREENGSTKVRYSQTWELPLYKTHNQKIEQQPFNYHMMLGIQNNLKFETLETTLEPGERVICFTDGLGEQEGPNEHRFEESKEFEQTLQQSCRKPSLSEALSLIAQSCDRFRGKKRQYDDMTIIGLQLNTASSPKAHSTSSILS